MDGSYWVVAGYKLNAFAEDSDGVFRKAHPTDATGRIIARHAVRPMLLCSAKADRWGIPHSHQLLMVQGHIHNIAREEGVMLWSCEMWEELRPFRRVTGSPTGRYGGNWHHVNTTSS